MEDPGANWLSPTAQERFRLHRAGILNVWQYDDQVFTFADGRLLLRGVNGAGKSKTLEMLLPFALDGDKQRITASGKHHTSLLWLMTDGYEGQARVGYIWVEFLRTGADGSPVAFTCGVGIRSSASNRSATAWHFSTSRRIGHDLFLEDEAGPLARGRLEQALGDDGKVFERAAAYKEHVGRELFGLDPDQYDEVLRLLYWLRQPQIGEDIEPARLTEQLSQALPQLEERAIRSAGETFDELTAFGEQIERRAAAAEALSGLAADYQHYAKVTVAIRARALAEALRTEGNARAQLRRAEGSLGEARDAYSAAEQEQAREDALAKQHLARHEALKHSREADQQRELERLQEGSAKAADRAGRDISAAATAKEDEGGVAASTRKRQTAAEDGLTRYRDTVAGLGRRLASEVPGAVLPAVALPDPVVLSDAEQEASVLGALSASGGHIGAARREVSRRRAAVTLLSEAIGQEQAAANEQSRAEQLADDAEDRWEKARKSRLEALHVADRAADELGAGLRQWSSLPASPGVVLPEELDEETVSTLPGRAREASAPVLKDLRDRQHNEVSRRDQARSEVARLEGDRQAVAEQRDPAPPPPALPRTERPDGHPFWRVVDVTDGVEEAQRAGLEAALQASGLLDAWVRPGGQLLGAEHLDVVLVGRNTVPSASGPALGTLATVLRPDLPPDSDLTTDDVSAVLAAIGFAADAESVVPPETVDGPVGVDKPDSGQTVWVTADGSWRLGLAHGRASKPDTQYLGATARAAERARRLAALDADIKLWRVTLEEAEAAADSLAARIRDLEDWVAAVPSASPLIKAWSVTSDRQRAEDEAETRNRSAQDRAHAARQVAAEKRAALDRLSVEHGLPSERRALKAVEESLRNIDARLKDAARDADDYGPIHQAVRHWVESLADLHAAQGRLAAAQERAEDSVLEAQSASAAYGELLEAVGDSVRDLQERMTALRDAQRAHEEAAAQAGKRLTNLAGARGRAEQVVVTARERLQQLQEGRAAVLAALARLGEVPGILRAAGVESDDSSTIAGLSALPSTEAVPRALRELSDRLASLSDATDNNSVRNQVWKAHGNAQSGPASDHQPTILEFSDLLAVTARDEAGEADIVALANRATAAVDRDRGLLTDREKQQFEQHILGELGDAVRRCRRSAEELVAAMNRLLQGVTTSQGIRVSLRWDLRDDLASEARRAVDLLAHPVGALTPEERVALRDVLHRLIEASRAEHPELSYAEHLAAALDYRTWSRFVIRYSRPERPGVWDQLHRRSALSQGEQKVLCYLPLFAAAAAHFTSLAGAAPHAPRLVLLDDAFPKIDVRTHPLLFGLLVQLQLDFVITSERLWGDHDTVPSLAIYEALRDPLQRGIAQYEYRWDGRALHSIG